MRKTFQAYSNEQLVRVLHIDREHYRPEAIAAAQEELDRRNIDAGELEAMVASLKPPEQLRREDCLALERFFSQTDLLLARTILAEGGIPFYADCSVSSDIIPTQRLAERQFQIHVHRDHLEQARQLLEEHFRADGGAYRLKELPLREQLKLMNFYELQLDENQILDSVEIELSDQERDLTAQYARRLLKEADRLEQERGRTIFYFDNLSSCTEKLDSGATNWTIADVLTILEVVQTYCDEPQFPSELDHMIKGLLEFFRSISEK